MNKFILCLCSFLIAANVQAQVQPQSFTLTPAVTGLAANNTNSSAGTAKMLYVGESPVRIYLTATGAAATTNGSLIVKFSTASGLNYSTTNSYDTASESNIKLTMSTLGNNTVTVSDWFVLSGAKYLRVGQIENNFAGAVTNLVINVGYADK
jgi:hypothetical protein